MTLPLFYEEPDSDRWLPFDRYPRGIVRRIIRGNPSPGGHRRVFLNLCAGLDKIGVPYRINDYKYAKQHPDQIACIIGKPFLLDKIGWENPILFGAAGYSHPIDDPYLLERSPTKQVLVPCEWMRRMCEPYWGNAVAAWPVGIDTELWREISNIKKPVNFLLYDKVRWEHDAYEASLLSPIRTALNDRGLSFCEIRYGFYREEQFRELLTQCRAMIFLCEHETQGIAYQQALSAGVPILAWDRGGDWQDPSYYPDKVKFGPVTSVPYWDHRCGEKFHSIVNFDESLDEFWTSVRDDQYRPREYILENLTLEKCAKLYLNHVRVVAGK